MTGVALKRWWIVVLVVPLVAGCLGQTGTSGSDGPQLGSDDDGGNATAAWSLPDEITGLQLQTNVDDVQAGSGIRAEGDHLYVSGQNSGFYAVNVSDPTQPTVAGQLGPDEAGYNRDVDLLHVGERTVAALARQGDMAFVDVTDPTNLTFLSKLDTGQPVHNLAVVPGTTTVYTSRSLGDLQEAGIDIVDASDPSDANVETRWTFPSQAAGQPVQSTGCHDITFRPVDDRAYCAGVTQTYIMGISDPLDPEIDGVVTNPAIQIHHQAFPLYDGTVLAIADEFAGSSSASYGCYGHADPAGVGASDPVGGLWFYDISDPEQPTPMSWIAPPAPVDNPEGMSPCTAHFGTAIEDRDRIVVGWRNAGTWLVDTSDLTNPLFLDSFGDATRTWEARYHDGFVYTGDVARGMDVLRLTGGG